MGNKGILALGIIILILGVWLIFSSGADLRNLPLLDISAKLGNAELNATDVSPEAQTKIMSGFVLSIVGIIVIVIGGKR